ncbi:MAG: immune inhibitor A [Candidatus Latescibacteria bacterium]|nr:immune inhibitor A [Candidatus Latescibacterota bacterium]
MDLDLAQFDNDGPDGIPDSGDDDGVVDVVFIVMDRVPADFLQGKATGIANLGFPEVFPTSDTGAKGKAILIFPGQGTIQQGRSFAEAVGSICHEYGHVLGLPDLYNTSFLGKEGAGPEEDSAGVGAWCLMGWGATGWNGNDGPNSFCAWSRMKLGWSPVVSLSHDREQVELKDAGQGGVIFQLPVNDREVFLVEYRRRDGNYYDRHIPGEGVLIWHAVPRPLIERKWSPVLVDLECADGRWRDAGYPWGKEVDSERGGDNLDFWAHDQAYLKAHGGNLGDATDVFDGVRFATFTPQTNPSSFSDDGQSSVRIEHLQIDGEVARMEVQTAPRLLAVENIRLVDASGDGVIAVGEEVELLFWVANRGGVEVPQIEAVLSTEDTLVEILHREKAFGDLRVGRTEVGSFGGVSPRFSLRGGFAGTHTASLYLDLYSGSERVGQYPLVITAGAARQAIQEVSLIDSSGNRDGQAQAGEIVQLSIALGNQHETVLPAVGFLVQALDSRVQQLGSPAMFFRMVDASLALSAKGPEFLLPSTIKAGEILPFELEVKGIGSWKDTIEVQVQQGKDQTPPRVNLLRVQVGTPEGLGLLLADRWVVDGSPLRSAQVGFYKPQDTTLVAVVPLERQGEGFAGSWREAPPGVYLVAAEVEDAEGNRGRSPLLRVVALAPGSAGEDPAQAGETQLWEPLHLSTAQSAAEISGVTIAPGNPKVVYAAGPMSLWRSEDSGQTWSKTGLMFNGLYGGVFIQLFADPQAPGTVYLSEYPLVLKSSDGGRRWAPMGLPDQILSLRVDSILPGRLYGYSYALQKLFVSEDEGQSWRESGLTENPSLLLTHPAAPQHLYAGVRIGETKGVLWHSGDGGHTWQGIEQGQVIRGLSPDPRDPNALYGAGVSKVLYSPDLGRTWQELGGVTGGIDGIQVHTRVPEVIYAWGGSKLWVSRDSGRTWKMTGLPGGVKQVALNPDDPSQLFLVLILNKKSTLWRCWDFGESQAQVEIHQEDTPAGGMAFTPTGQPFVASLQEGAPGFFTRTNDGRFWEWQESPALYGVSIGSTPSFFEMLYIDPLQPQVMIAHYALGLNQFARSADGGRTWERMKVGLGSGWGYGGARYVPKVVGRPHSPGVYFLVSRIDASLQRSIDFGETWEQAGRLPVENTISTPGLVIDPLNDETFYAAANENT